MDKSFIRLWKADSLEDTFKVLLEVEKQKVL
jgi:hypothetical protein